MKTLPTPVAMGYTPKQFTAFQAAEIARWKQVIALGKTTAT